MNNEITEKNNLRPHKGIPLWVHMAAVMGVITILLCIGLGVFVKLKATQTVMSQYTKSLDELNSMVSELLTNDIIVGNKSNLYEKVIQISKIHHNFASILVTDRDGNTLIDWHKNSSSKQSTLATKNSVTIAGENFGTIISRWSAQDINEEIERRWKTVVIIVLGFFFVLTFHLLITMKFTLFNPLNKIKRRFASFSERNVDSFLPRTHWTSVEFNNIESVADLLEQEIKARLEVEKKLQIANNQANQANDAKSQFLANMSHELRTPLNAILGYSELLKEIAEEKDEKEAIEDLEKIRKSGEHLLQLVNGVLDLSKIEAGKIILSDSLADTRAIALELVDTVQPMVNSSNSRIICNIDNAIEPFYLDTLRFRQILFNLLSNAAKFTRNGMIELTIRKGDDEDQGYICYCVRDTGIGIAEEKLEQIFEDFVQANADTSHNYGGTGLGLAISKKLSRLMGGDIIVSSEVGKGSIFTLKIPFKIESIQNQKIA